MRSKREHKRNNEHTNSAVTPPTAKDKAVAAAAAAVQHQKAEKERSWPALHLLKNEKKTACTPFPSPLFKSPLFSTPTTIAPTFARANEERIEDGRQCRETEGQENVEEKNKKEK